MSFATVSSKGQVTLPVKIRKKMGIRSKDKIQFLVRENEIIIKPLRPFRELRGIINSKNGNSRTVAHEAAAKHVMETDD